MFGLPIGQFESMQFPVDHSKTVNSQFSTAGKSRIQITNSSILVNPFDGYDVDKNIAYGCCRAFLDID